MQNELHRKIQKDRNFYADLMINLILEVLANQGMVQMMEPELLIFCLEKDKGLVNSILRTCEGKFKETIEEQLGTSRD